MRRCIWSSVRRTTSVGWAVSTSSIRSDWTARGEGGGRQAVGTPARERIGARTGLRVGSAIARIVAAPADAMMLLGDIAPASETARTPGRSVPPTRAVEVQTIGQFLERGGVAGMCPLGERARVLDELEQRLAFKGMGASPNRSPSNRTSSRNAWWGSRFIAGCQRRRRSSTGRQPGKMPRRPPSSLSHRARTSAACHTGTCCSTRLADRSVQRQAFEERVRAPQARCDHTARSRLCSGPCDPEREGRSALHSDAGLTERRQSRTSPLDTIEIRRIV